MHELALAEGVREIVEDTARRHGAQRVSVVRLELGALSHVEPEALRFCFDAVMRGGLAEGASLAIARTPGQAWCMPCARAVALARVGDACPCCGSYQLAVTQGDAMRVVDIEIH
ncbi:MAG TPA: hydrogenase maturation nickel metallochaperone HypA [Casimicrobiaceae bacterium]|nr:hydrogenase maturation nickel metallochaperone HypA [Casimicrobiaceae bacterium]